MNCGIIPSNMKTKLKLSAAALMTGAALGCMTGLSVSCTRQGGSALKQIDQAALQIMVDTTARELLIPGVVVLLHTPQGAFTVTYGTTLLGANSPPSADTHFRIASNTKTMTAAVIVLLAQEGKLSLDDPVSKYVPGVPNGDNITIIQLLEMRSGLYNYTNDPIISETIDRDPAKVWTPAELLALGSRHWLAVGCSTRTISTAGSTACNPRTRANPKAKSTGTVSPNLAGDLTRFIFTAVRPLAITRKSATIRPTT
jgi:CubicO group peptidase (beta-lactamase class C family)